MQCKNCKYELFAENNYCPECGAKVIKHRLTLRNIWHDISEKVLNLDNSLFKTFKHLLTQPGTVINDYIEGTRKKYVNVIQYFAISLTLVGIQVFLINMFFKDSLIMDDTFSSLFATQANQTENPFADSNIFIEINNYQSIIYILTLPISAISTWLGFWVMNNRRLNFTEHVVLNLYYSAQIIIITCFLSIVILCFGFNYFVVSSYLSILTIAYLFFVLKQVFNMKFWNALLHFLVTILFIGVGYVILMIFAGVVGVAYVLINQ